MIRSFKYRLYPTKAQKARLGNTLALCCDLYNAGLEQRISVFRANHVSLNYRNQAGELPCVVEEIPDFNQVYSQTRQDVLRRGDKSFKGFFRRLKTREKPGYPRFRGKRRYDSFTYPQNGFGIKDGRLYLAKLGSFRIKLHRPITGTVKTCAVKREVDQWFAVFSCEIPDTIKLKINEFNDVGIDVGIEHFLVSSDGEFIANAFPLKKSRKRLRRAQKSLCRKMKGSNRRKKQRILVAKLHRKIRRQREDFLHKVSRMLVDKYDVFYLEDLRINNMLKNHRLAFHIQDASWGSFINFLSYKAEEAGKEVVFVDPRGTSQRCSQCGNIVKKDLSQRLHLCPFCGFQAQRDFNSALEIKRLGRSLQALTRPDVTVRVA